VQLFQNSGDRAQRSANQCPRSERVQPNKARLNVITVLEAYRERSAAGRGNLPGLRDGVHVSLRQGACRPPASLVLRRRRAKPSVPHQQPCSEGQSDVDFHVFRPKYSRPRAVWQHLIPLKWNAQSLTSPTMAPRFRTAEMTEWAGYSE